jgi:hypothetical protein
MTVVDGHVPVSLIPLYSSHIKSSKKSSKPTRSCDKESEPTKTITVTENEATLTVTTTIFEDIFVDCTVSKGKTQCTTVYTDFKGGDSDYVSGYKTWSTSVEGEGCSTSTQESKPKETSGSHGYGY